MDRSKVGTRITLSDRFKLIRQEQQTRKIIVNPMIEPPIQQQRIGGRQMKNFNGTVSRADRPSAFLQQGSERNRRLVLQMATNAQLMEELQQTNMFVNVPVLPKNKINTVNKKPVQNVHDRLGLRGMAAVSSRNGKLTGNIKRRLGLTRKPILQRLGLTQTLKSRGRISMRNRSNGFIVANQQQNINRQPTRIFKSKKPFVGKTKININNSNRIKNIRIRRRPRLSNQKNNNPKLTVEHLDQDLDSYMSAAVGNQNNGNQLI